MSEIHDKLGARYDCLALECAHAHYIYTHNLDSLDGKKLYRKGMGWNTHLIVNF